MTVTDSPRRYKPTINYPVFVEDGWKQWAACKGEVTDWWFARDGRSREARTAKAICRRCTVREECLDYAYRIGDRHAILGGTTPKQRANSKKQRNNPNRASMEAVKE